MKKWGSLFAVAALACSSTALADGYAGVSYSSWEYVDSDENGGEKIDDVGDLSVRFGGEINTYWTIELRLGTTVAPHEFDDGSDGELSQTSASIMSRFQYPMGAFKPYVAAGYTSATVTLSAPGVDDEEDSFNDPSFALGFDMGLGESLAVNAEYAQLMEAYGVKVRGPSIGLYYQFR